MNRESSDKQQREGVVLVGHLKRVTVQVPAAHLRALEGLWPVPMLRPPTNSQLIAWAVAKGLDYLELEKADADEPTRAR